MITIPIPSPPLSYAGRFTIPPLGSGDGTLTISDVVIADSSVYQCQATNSAGSDTSDTIQLRILSKPHPLYINHTH